MTFCFENQQRLYSRLLQSQNGNCAFRPMLSRTHIWQLVRSFICVGFLFRYGQSSAGSLCSPRACPAAGKRSGSNSVAPHQRGYYIHPELYGAPEEKGVEWGAESSMDAAGARAESDRIGSCKKSAQSASASASRAQTTPGPVNTPRVCREPLQVRHLCFESTTVERYIHLLDGLGIKLCR
jgi:hypothetical protein